MTTKHWIDAVFQQEDLNFALTNRIPRQLVTRFMGRFSKIEQPWVRDLSIGVWRLFTELDLSEAESREFRSMHDCFTRRLKPDARPLDGDPSVLISPCDAVVGAVGSVWGTELIQAKDSRYTLEELLRDPELVSLYRDGTYVTLRLTSSMYHRFHAPADLTLERVTYVAGDTWNTNPTTLARVPKLFCKNERAVLRTRLSASALPITLVPVASILVASIRLHALDVLLHVKHPGPNVFACQASYRKGEEMGWFQHGSTILVFAPRGVTPCSQVASGAIVRMGQSLFQLASG